MKIEQIELYNFRNYKKYIIGNFSDVNIIIGNNGVGKTSILEAIYYGSLTKSFKTKNDKIIIKNGSKCSKVKIMIKKENTVNHLQIVTCEGGKKTKINNTNKRRLSDFISFYKVVVYSPDEIKIIKDLPNTRRNYFNMEISQIYKDYIYKLNLYNKIIKTKNIYLKKCLLSNKIDDNYLDVMDEKIVEIGLELTNYRSQYIDKINKYLNKYFRKYKKEKIMIKYVSFFANKNKQELINEFHLSRNKEIKLAQTIIGIHKDDYEFIYNNQEVRDFCSQGIQKLFILSLKFSQISVLQNEYYHKPIILLDDLFSELDINNQNKIIKNLLKDIQIFITTTDLKKIDNRLIKKAKIIELEESNE